MGLTAAPSAQPTPTGTATSRWTDGTWLRRMAWATLVGNVLIVLTGGAVRLTQSGLGCSSWPTCTAGQWTPHAATGIHGAIEFGNRMVTFLLAAIAIATLVAALRTAPRGHRRRGTVAVPVALGLGIPGQAVIGGITVLTGLNPWIVGLHMFLSMLLIGGSVVLIDLARGRPREASPRLVRAAAYATLLAAIVALYVGTLVTGSGPWAGDADAVRNGLDPLSVTHVHTAAVYALVGLTVATAAAAHRVPRVRAAALTLLLVEVAQGAVGFYQYYNGMPAVVIELHLLGAALVAAAAAQTAVAATGRQ